MLFVVCCVVYVWFVQVLLAWCVLHVACCSLFVARRALWVVGCSSLRVTCYVLFVVSCWFRCLMRVVVGPLVCYMSFVLGMFLVCCALAVVGVALFVFWCVRRSFFAVFVWRVLFVVACYVVCRLFVLALFCVLSCVDCCALYFGNACWFVDLRVLVVVRCLLVVRCLFPLGLCSLLVGIS